MAAYSNSAVLQRQYHWGDTPLVYSFLGWMVVQQDEPPVRQRSEIIPLQVCAH